MASVTKRKLQRGGHSYLVRYRGPDGRVRNRQFPKRALADRYANSIEVARNEGTWIDPSRGGLSLAEWVERWEPTQVNLRPSSRARDESYLRVHIVPRFGALPLTSIEHADVRAWAADLSNQLAPATVAKAVQILAKIL